MAELNYEAVEEENNFERFERIINEKGVMGAQEEIKAELDGWKNVKVKIGVTGNSGVGKSTFINTIRDIKDDDKPVGNAKVANTDVIETTLEPASFSYPGNPNIELWDLPGIGTKNQPDLDTYCEKANLATYDTFLILTATRFTQLEFELAKKIKADGKSFFLVRTKIDIDEYNDRRKNKHNTDAMLERIKGYCHESVKDLEIRRDEIFLISNVYDDISNWDFNRLVNAMLEKLPTDQKEALTLTLKTLSKDFVERKVKLFKSRLWRLAFLFALVFPLDLVSFNLASFAIYKVKIKQKAKFYISQLGLPEEDSDEFKALKPKYQEKMRKFYPKEDNNFWKDYFIYVVKKFFPCYDPKLFSVYSMTKKSLENILGDMQVFSLAILDEASAGLKKDSDSE